MARPNAFIAQDAWTRGQRRAGPLVLNPFVPPSSADIIAGQDTYGWPPFDDNPWQPPQRTPLAVLINYQSSAVVPQIVGLLEGIALVFLNNAQLVGLLVGTDINRALPIGTVETQSPAAGTVVQAGTQVAYTKTVSSPYTYLDDAISIMVNAGLIVSQPVQYQPSSVVPKDYVISQTPPKGATAYPNTPVFFVVSSGPANVEPTITVPNVVGLPYLDAQNALSIAGLNAVNPTWVNSSTVNDTIVIAQSVAGGTMVTAQEAVYLTVSMGPALVPYSAQAISVPAVTP